MFRASCLTLEIFDGLILPHAGKTLTTLTLGTISACLRASGQISGTYQSMISSLDDTICSKETADTLVYMHSEIETEDYSDVGLDEEARADWVDEKGSGRHVGVPNGMRVRLLKGGRDESEENGSSDGASSNGARSTQTDSDRQATSDQSESEDESCDGSRDRLASL